MTKLKLVIFDCDGVMFDSIEANRAYYNTILQYFHHPPMDDDELRFVHVSHVEDSVRHIFRRYNDDWREIEKYRASQPYTPFLQYMRLEADLPEFLNFLMPDIARAISTNRANTMSSILEMFDLAKYFDKVVTSVDVKNPKPHPEALHKILAHFRLTVPECIYIGDSQVDAEHTAAVNMRLIAFKNPELTADYHVNSFTEITKLPIWGP
ncbi:MAG: HAD family hydrolase [Deltaproteobacteria bacterium]|nr:HAD family hydrolase [Deltaproteobacteria bacterium]